MTETPATSYDELLARSARLVASLTRPAVIGISGHGGAGKSTLAARLAADLGATRDAVVATDRFFAEGAGPSSGLWDLHDWAALDDLLRRVRATPTPDRLTYPARTWDGDERVHDAPMPPLVLVEGIRLLREDTAPLLDLSVWIDLAPGPAGERAVARNRAQGDGAAELDLWRTKWIPEGDDYAALVRPDRLADVVVAATGGQQQ